jgi:hypothetical protein
MHRIAFTAFALAVACNASSADPGGSATKRVAIVPSASGPTAPPIVVVEGAAADATKDRSLPTPRESGTVGVEGARSVVGASDTPQSSSVATPSERLERALDRLEKDILGS